MIMIMWKIILLNKYIPDNYAASMLQQLQHSSASPD